MAIFDGFLAQFRAPDVAPALDDPGNATTVTINRPAGGPMAITASAARVLPSSAAALRRARQRWQTDAWTYRDAVPEVRYALNFLANACAQIRLYAAQLANDGHEPIDLDDERCTLPPDLIAAARAAMDRLTGSAAGHGAILSPVVQNFETVGECYVLGYTDPNTGVESWSIRSMDELQVTDTGYRLVDSTATSAVGIDLPAEGTYVARMWSPHPRFSSWPDSPMRALLDVCEELMLAGRERRAALRNRIAGNGLLAVPNELIQAGGSGSGELAGEGDDWTTQQTDDLADPRASKFMADLTTAMTTPIGDESAASAVVPMLVRGPAEALKELRHLTIDRPADKRLADSEEKALRRLGTGLDVPPEVINGLADVNHWTAWQVDQSTFTHHVEPITASACAALTMGYLRATLLGITGPTGVPLFSLAQVNQVVLWYDPSDLVEDPRGVEEVGETGRTPAELQTLAQVAQTLIPLGFDAEGVLDMLGLPTLAWERPVVAPAPTPPGQTTPADPAPVDGPPENDGEVPAPETPAPAAAAVVAAAAEATDEQLRLSRRLMEIDRRLRERLTGAADAALARALERAGNRVRSAANRDPALVASLNGHTGLEVPRILGRAVVASLGLDEAELLADEFARLRTQWSEWTDAAQEEAIDTAVRLLGPNTNSETIQRLVGELRDGFHAAADAGWAFLETGLGDLAAEHLYNPDPDVPELGELPDTLVPPSIVRAAIATAGGLRTAIAGLTRDGLPGERNQGVGGIGQGELLGDFMRGQGAEISQYEWSYGISSRPFPPHQALDGTRFATWGAPELSTAGTGHEWVGASFGVGDHKGCHCDYAAIWLDGTSQRDVLDQVGDAAGGIAADEEQARLRAGRERRAAARVPQPA